MEELNTNFEEKIFANALNLVVELGPVKLTRLYKYFGSFAKAWSASLNDYLKAGLDEKSATAVIAKKSGLKPTQAWEDLTKHKIEVLLISDQGYPNLLKEISNPPPVLYIRGETKILNKICLAVVGSRKMTAYGRQAVQELVPGFAAAGITVVSGLAFGVDATALEEAIKNGGVVAAILASPLDNASISPKINFKLAQKVIEHGCLVSEYALGEVVQKQNFPIRNRIIAGLCVGTLVVEADQESGALITANFALEQNREVFAVPGSIFSELSQGTNNLIKQGAKLVNNNADILEELNLQADFEQPALPESATLNEQTVMENLSKTPIHIDDLIKQTKLAPATVNATLSLLELSGRVKNLGGGLYVKIR